MNDQDSDLVEKLTRTQSFIKWYKLKPSTGEREYHYRDHEECIGFVLDERGHLTVSSKLAEEQSWNLGNIPGMFQFNSSLTNVRFMVQSLSLDYTAPQEMYEKKFRE